MALINAFEEFQITKESIIEALGIAGRKSPHINPKGTSGSIRPIMLIATNIFHGAIAQIAVEKMLLRYGALSVEIYDRIRTNGFIHHDPWDMRATFAGKVRDIEVRSSYLTARCSKHDDLKEILKCIYNSYNVLGTYQTSYKPGELRKELFFQVYWPYDVTQAISFYKCCEKSLPNKLGSCFIVGFATQKLFKRVGQSTSLGQSGASFQVISIKDAYPCSKLRELC